MCGSGGAADDPYTAKQMQHGGRGSVNPYAKYYKVDKEATKKAESKRLPGRGGMRRNLTVYEKDEYGRNALRDGYMYSDANGKDTGAALGRRGRGMGIWLKGKSNSGERVVRPGDKRGGTAAEAPEQVDAGARNGGRAAKSKLSKRAGGTMGSGNKTILTGSHGLGGSAKTNKTLLGG